MNTKDVRPASLALSGSIWLSLAHSGSLWLAVRLSLALSGSLWLTLAHSGSLLLSEFAWLSRPLLSSKQSNWATWLSTGLRCVSILESTPVSPLVSWVEFYLRLRSYAGQLVGWSFTLSDFHSVGISRLPQSFRRDLWKGVMACDVSPVAMFCLEVIKSDS